MEKLEINMAKDVALNMTKADTKVVKNTPYQLTRAIRNPALIDLLGDIKGKRLLDLGCSNGESSRQLHSLGAIVTGADYSATQIELAKSQDDGVNYILTAEDSKLALKSASFDVVTYLSMRATEHLDEMLAESSRVLKKSGKILLSVLHPSFIGPGKKVIKTSDGGAGIFVNHYLTEEVRVNSPRQPGSNQDKVSNLIRNHTVSDFINKLIQSGFVIQQVCEPRATDQAELADPEVRFWSTHAARYLIIMASKVK
jgi:2-polyprenyl-3-methyl-5-hydroxy-6-metoxy-1,4-benzoquinol methylase